MTGAVTTIAVAALLGATTLLGLFLAVWPPLLAAGTCTVALGADELRRGWRRWRVRRRRASRSSV